MLGQREETENEARAESERLGYDKAVPRHPDLWHHADYPHNVYRNLLGNRLLTEFKRRNWEYAEREKNEIPTHTPH